MPGALCWKLYKGWFATNGALKGRFVEFESAQIEILPPKFGALNWPLWVLYFCSQGAICNGAYKNWTFAIHFAIGSYLQW